MELPNEIITMILTFVPLKSLLNCSLICILWYDVVENIIRKNKKYVKKCMKKYIVKGNIDVIKCCDNFSTLTQYNMLRWAVKSKNESIIKFAIENNFDTRKCKIKYIPFCIESNDPVISDYFKKYKNNVGILGNALQQNVIDMVKYFTDRKFLVEDILPGYLCDDENFMKQYLMVVYQYLTSGIPKDSVKHIKRYVLRFASFFNQKEIIVDLCPQLENGFWSYLESGNLDMIKLCKQYDTIPIDYKCYGLNIISKKSTQEFFDMLTRYFDKLDDYPFNITFSNTIRNVYLFSHNTDLLNFFIEYINKRKITLYSDINQFIPHIMDRIDVNVFSFIYNQVPYLTDGLVIKCLSGDRDDILEIVKNNSSLRDLIYKHCGEVKNKTFAWLIKNMGDDVILKQNFIKNLVINCSFKNMDVFNMIETALDLGFHVPDDIYQIIIRKDENINFRNKDNNIVKLLDLFHRRGFHFIVSRELIYKTNISVRLLKWIINNQNFNYTYNFTGMSLCLVKFRWLFKHGFENNPEILQIMKYYDKNGIAFSHKMEKFKKIFNRLMEISTLDILTRS